MQQTDHDWTRCPQCGGAASYSLLVQAGKRWFCMGCRYCWTRYHRRPSGAVRQRAKRLPEKHA